MAPGILLLLAHHNKQKYTCIFFKVMSSLTFFNLNLILYSILYNLLDVIIVSLFFYIENLDS